MAPASKADKKAAVDAAAWMFNVVTSVGIIIVNKALMATYGFSFGKSCFVFFRSYLIYSSFPAVHSIKQNYLIPCIIFF